MTEERITPEREEYVTPKREEYVTPELVEYPPLTDVIGIVSAWPCDYVLTTPKNGLHVAHRRLMRGEGLYIVQVQGVQNQNQ